MNEKNQEEKPDPPKRPKPDPDLKDPRNMEDEPPSIILEQSELDGNE